MEKGILIKMAIVIGMLCGAGIPVAAQSVNAWRGNEIKANWTDAYKWQLKHIPAGGETIQFRQANSVVAINSTIDLDNGIQLYGQELSLEGNGNINLWSPIPHQSTVYIPASSTGYANLTLNDTLAIDGTIALAAKEFGTASSKGSVTLKDRSTISGKLLIGNNGNGSGKVFIRDKSTYRISGLELNTKADVGGSAEIHILGGTAEFAAETDPFAVFLEDPSRKIIIGESGTLRIQSDWPIDRKAKAITQMIDQKRLVADRRCELTTPVIQNNMVLIKAECTEAPKTLNALLANISHPEKNKDQPAAAPVKINALVDSLKKNQTATPESPRSAKPPHTAAIQPESIAKAPTTSAPASENDQPSVPLASYIAFFSAFLLLLRPTKRQ